MNLALSPRLLPSVLVLAAAFFAGCRAPSLPHIGQNPNPTVPATPTSVLPPNPDGLLRWDTLPVHYCIDESDQGFLSETVFIDLVHRAFADWGVPTTDDGACAGPSQEGDGVNEIGWGSPEGERVRRRSFEAGVTLLRSNECVSNCNPDDRVHLVEADIIIDRNPPSPFHTQACVYSTLLHETGHFLGLEHLPAPAVMAAETSSCPQELTPADRAALVDRYGPSPGRRP